VPDDPLWTQRHGGSLGLTRDGFNELIGGLLAHSREAGLFEEFLGIRPGPRYLALSNTAQHDAAEFFT
jgi:hypothetical protein